MSLKLKYLEIEDFKTYYGKHVFGPLPSFTAVIGPNGGGKSNILDAIAFVLGERLTALRVKKGKQLIHREKAVDDGEGDDAATASVTAVFSLPDGSEKAFKRVMSSQGSEFLVDGTEVSFSTYQKRLQELGINLLCRNFIVFQGSVESIAMYGSNEKVKMFEEISGSSALKTEYNHLRKEMARAEEEMTADFEKLNMVVSQYHDLKLDRRQEQKYEELEKEYKREKIKLQLFRLYHIGTAQEGLQGEVEVKEQALKELKEKGKKQAENLEEKRKNQTVIVQEMGSMEQNVGELEIQLSKKRSELVTVKDCLAERMKKKNICSNLLAKAKDAQDDQLRKLEDLKKELEKTEILAAQFEKRLAEEALKMGKSVQLEGEQLKKYHQLKQQVGQCCVTLQQKVDYLSRQLKTQLDQLANENRRMEERQEALRRKQEEVQDLKKRIERLTANLKLKKESLAEKQQVLKDMQKEVICKRDRVKRLQNELETLTDELNEATWDVNQIQRHTKKREVLEMLREKFPGIYDRLKNLCQPIHPKYHLAITRVLFKHLDSIVVDNEVTARRCINYLCDQRIDRETFLPLNYLQVHPVRESLRAIQDPQNVKLAFDLIKFEPPEVKVHGQEAQVKYVSLELDHFHNQIEELEEQQRKMEEELMIHTDLLETMQAATTEHEMEILEVKEEMNKKENEIFEDFCREIGVPDICLFENEGLQILMEREQERLKFEKQKSRIMSLISYEENRDMEKDVKKWDVAIAAQTKALAEAKKEENEKIGEIEAIMKLVAEARSELVKKGQTLHKAEETVDAAQEEARLLRREREKMQNRISRIRQKIAVLRVERQTILQQCHIKDMKLPLVSGSLQQALGQGMESSASSSREISSELQSQSEPNIEVDFSSLSRRYRELENEEQRNNVEEHIVTKISRLEENLGNLQPPKKNTRQSLIQLDQQVKAMRVALREKQHLARSAKDAFEKVKQQRRRLFMDCFSSVSEKIDHLFKTLCHDNTAQAMLETDNQEEPYLGSIIYHCIPPGKRCQQMCTLSGGEKAIASLVLLFALHSYNPVPFFILDEVDAALDKINICRVTSYLRKNKEEMQIVVISHKDRLYHKADALIGITFRTNGYSKVFSLDLTPYRMRRHHSHHSLSPQPQQQSSTSAMEVRKME
ncbi:hypothetical protein O3P69_006358 [Scylla paramamosain]|uniref:SMC hinge domain-containing protein n=1 Tax=Scylla paramamosain TaxID=85552 RepID=A0AAW0U2A0_SCYPA